MPGKLNREHQTGPRITGPALAAAALLVLLSGCVGDTWNGIASRLQFNPQNAEPGVTTTANGGALAEEPGTDQGAIVNDLQARRSVLPQGSAFAAISAAVLAQSSGAAAAELRIARLKAEAQEKNWLPQIGPQVSLTSLSGLVASLLVEAAVFDNGRRKAEREFAAADVELAAVSLSEEMNGRVGDALASYVTAQRALAQAAIAERALGRLGEYQRIMRVRVEGGLSDASEQQIMDQTIIEMQATLSADRQTAAVAQDELASLTGGPMAGLSGLAALPPDQPNPEPLALVRARADGARDLARSRMERAGLLPGVGVSAEVGADGSVTPALGLGMSQLFGLGTAAALEATAATEDLVQRNIAEAADTSRRAMEVLSNDIATLQLRQSQGATVLAQTTANLDMFVRQYEVGRRSLLELVGEFDRQARLERDQAALSYEIVLKQLALAEKRGVLAGGDQL